MHRHGFTLVELLVTIAILAVVAGAVVALSNGLTTSSAVTVTIATQKQLTNSLTEYYQAHGKLLPDGFDSLIRSDHAVAGASATWTMTGPIELVNRTTATGNNADGSSADSGPGFPRGIIYTGYDANQDGACDAGSVAKGLTVMSWSGQGVHTLTVAKLNAADLAGLKRLGISTVYDIAANVDVDAEGKLTYVKRTLAVGDPVVVLDPGGLASTYNSFTDTTGLSTNADKLTYRPHFIVLGIGPNSTLVGDRRGGVQEAPVCSTVVTWITAKPRGGIDYYNRYMAVIKMPVDPADSPSFAGVLDANGWGVRSAEIWYVRNLE
ncbi:MAG: prepilin-type N-terminal cleavage/methylation domain-containing protein [Planctomycetes bacterium]|nr:prepilin-type N-terminal cleavage/methylation domain-containing protein [Planctomycetota bacterium]